MQLACWTRVHPGVGVDVGRMCWHSSLKSKQSRGRTIPASGACRGEAIPLQSAIRQPGPPSPGRTPSIRVTAASPPAGPLGGRGHGWSCSLTTPQTPCVNSERLHRWNGESASSLCPLASHIYFSMFSSPYYINLDSFKNLYTSQTYPRSLNPL